MVIVAVLNAARNAFSFFLLLIVCMGYGVVKPSLGKTMIYVRILAIGHFVFAVVYSIASLSITPDSAGPLVLLIVLPLAGTLTAFYVWTLNSLNATMKDLINRKQKTKAMMYKKLWWCILGSIIVIFGFFFINSRRSPFVSEDGIIVLRSSGRKNLTLRPVFSMNYAARSPSHLRSSFRKQISPFFGSLPWTILRKAAVLSCRV